MALDLCQNFVSAQFLENNDIFPELWPLIYAKNSFPFNILRTNGQNFTKFYICIDIDNIYVLIVTHHFSHTCSRVMALDLLGKFIAPQYLENKLTEFDKI